MIETFAWISGLMIISERPRPDQDHLADCPQLDDDRARCSWKSRRDHHKRFGRRRGSQLSESRASALACDAGHKGKRRLDEICRVIGQLASWDPLKRPSQPHPP